MSIDPTNAPTAPRANDGVETKVAAGAGGAGGGAALGALVLYLLDTFAYTPTSGIGDSVPGVVTTAVVVVFAALGSLVAGYRAPHTRR